MSIGPMGFFSVIAATSPQTSALAAPLAQTQSSDVDLVAHDVAEQARETDADTKAETAAGIGQTDGDEHSSNDRDADGRRLWERPLSTAEGAEADDEQPSADAVAEPNEADHPIKDASGQSGTQLDLTG